MANIVTIKKEFQELKRCLSTSELDIFALEEFKTIIGQRIFTFSKAVDDSSFGSYRSESYKKKREKERRQTVIKDLQFSGELRNDLDLGVYEGKNALGFSTDLSAVIVEGQENGSRTRSGTEVKQINKPIFSANQEEVDIVVDAVSLEIDKIIERCLNL